MFEHDIEDLKKICQVLRYRARRLPVGSRQDFETAMTGEWHMLEAIGRGLAHPGPATRAACARVVQWLNERS